MSLHRLTSIIVGVPNVEATAAFYREFGLIETAPGRFITADGGEQLVLTSAPQRNLLELGIGADDPDDLGRIAAALAQLGIAARHDAATLHTADPATGLPVVVRVTDRVVPRAADAAACNGPGHTTRTNTRAAAVARKSPVRPRKLGHVVMGSTDAALSRRFFVDGIGFKVSDEIPDVGGAFMRCSPDHHNVLVQQAPLSFLHHVAWEVDDIDEIGRGAQHLLADHPERHVWGPGRHCVGSNFFWYLRDPAGNFAEYYSDLDVIVDDERWKPAVWSGLETLKSWGPPVTMSFLAPEDLAERMAR